MFLFPSWRQTPGVYWTCWFSFIRQQLADRIPEAYLLLRVSNWGSSYESRSFRFARRRTFSSPSANWNYFRITYTYLFLSQTSPDPLTMFIPSLEGDGRLPNETCLSTSFVEFENVFIEMLIEKGTLTSWVFRRNVWGKV